MALSPPAPGEQADESAVAETLNASKQNFSTSYHVRERERNYPLLTFLFCLKLKSLETDYYLSVKQMFLVFFFCFRKWS